MAGITNGSRLGKGLGGGLGGKVTKGILAGLGGCTLLVTLFNDQLTSKKKTYDLYDIIANHHRITDTYKGDSYDYWLPQARDDTYEMVQATQDIFGTTNKDLTVVEKEKAKRKMYMAKSFYYTFWTMNKSNFVPNNYDYNGFAACFTGDDFEADGYSYTADETFDNLEVFFDLEIDDNKRQKMVSNAKVIKERKRSGNSKVTCVEDVDIDFDSVYYTFSTDGVNGSPNVCDSSNNVGWPYATCQVNSYTGAWNKMICASYASSRFWEVNYPDSVYPLPANWNQALYDFSHSASTPSSQEYATNFEFTKNINDVRECSIIEITGHVAFIETIFDDGSVIISEGNATKSNKYGFVCAKYDSISQWIGSRSFEGALMVKLDVVNNSSHTGNQTSK